MGITLVRVFTVSTALGLLGASTARAQSTVAKRDPALLAVSVGTVKHVETRDAFLGQWKDPNWDHVVWRIDAGKTPDEVVLTRFQSDSRFEIYRGNVIQSKTGPQAVFLDLTPLSAVAPAESEKVAHTIFKITVEHVSSYSIGTPAGMRKEFNGKLAKTFDRLTLIPLKKDALRHVTEAPPEKGEAARSPLAAYLERSGSREEHWAPSKAMSGVRKR